MHRLKDSFVGELLAVGKEPSHKTLTPSDGLVVSIVVVLVLEQDLVLALLVMVRQLCVLACLQVVSVSIPLNTTNQFECYCLSSESGTVARRASRW